MYMSCVVVFQLIYLVLLFISQYMKQLQKLLMDLNMVNERKHLQIFGVIKLFLLNRMWGLIRIHLHILFKIPFLKGKIIKFSCDP